MLIDKEIEINLNYRTRKHFIELGYPFDNLKQGEKVIVKIEDLPKGSAYSVNIKCDYCNETITLTRYREYLNHRKVIEKDCCFACHSIKAQEVLLLKYGVTNALQIPESKEKYKKTNINKYGFEYPSQSEEVKQKMYDTCNEKYGTKTFTQTEEYLDINKQTCLDKYGYENLSLVPEILNKRKETNLERYGFESVFQSPKIKEKIAQTKFENGSITTSSQQIIVSEMLLENGYNAILNYPFSNVTLDIALFIDDIKIDVEYDGWYWHQDKQKDRRRDEFLKSQGWKILRIRSGNLIPSINEINIKINKLLASPEKNWTQIILDDWKQQSSNSNQTGKEPVFFI